MLGVGPRGPLGRDEVPAGGGPSRLDERDAWVVLAGVTGVGPVSFERLLRAYGTAASVVAAAAEPGAGPRLIAATVGPEGGSPALVGAAAAELVMAAGDPGPRLRAVKSADVEVLTLNDDAYPSRLRRVDLPPAVLFVRGDPASLDPPRAVAVVGTRRPTGIGRATAGRIADAIACCGATVVSGLALGIDAAAHTAAVRGGFPTVAVIGGGHHHLYPAAHRGLVVDIVRAGGAVVSEFAPDTEPNRGTFPRRNRIISGLSDATVVVEAGLRSGALTTAAWALEQGRGLYIVPGRLDDPAVAGSLAFLREAGPEARVVAGIPELLEDLGLGNPVGRTDARPSGRRPGPAGATGERYALSSAEAAVAAAVEAGIATVDELVLATGFRGATVLGILTALEIRGLVLEAFGRYRAAGPLAQQRQREAVQAWVKPSTPSA